MSVRFFSAFPPTGTGKVKNLDLRAAIEAELGVRKVATA